MFSFYRIVRKIFYQDFQEFIIALNEQNVEYMIVGGYAVVLHGYHRSTGDLDIWVNPTKENFQKLKLAFSKFGLPTDAIKIEEFIDNKNFDVFTFGRPPLAIDIMTNVKGLHFGETYNTSEIKEIDGILIRVVNVKFLIAAKRAVGRLKDLDDIEHLDI